MLELPLDGAAGEELRREAHSWWTEAAAKAGIDVSGLDPDSSLAQKISWAMRAGLLIATVYARFSSKNQHSTGDQVRANVAFAGQRGMYVPPEFICIDEGVKGRRVRRDGLDRLKAILRSRQATVLLVFKVSRLFRQANLGYQLVQQEVVEEGLRAISVSQGIDTEDKKVWKAQLQLHGLMDDLLLDAIADHCREGLIGLFKRGYVVGALTMGYDRVEVPGATPTNTGKPRTVPRVNVEAAALIRQHYQWAREGMPLQEGLRRWRAAAGPCDPRSTTGKMSPSAYRRMLSRIRYTGRWEFGRKRNSWSSKQDYTRQVMQPDSEVEVVLCEELRIVSDELFLAVQKRLKSQDTGPQGPRKPKTAELGNLVTDVFWCPHCQRRFHTCGPKGTCMHCSSMDCPRRVIVNRAEAVAGVCEKLTNLLATDHALVEQVVAATQTPERLGIDDGLQKITAIESTIRTLTSRISDLAELAGEGSEADRAEIKAKIRAAQAERTTQQLELTYLKQAQRTKAISAQEVHEILKNFGDLLQSGAAGTLGPDAVYKSADLFRRLVGGRVDVFAETRPGRKRAVVRGRFTPQLVTTIAQSNGVHGLVIEQGPAEVEVWLRKPPRLDAIAPEVRRLYEDEKLGFKVISKRLRVNLSNVYLSYFRYYEMNDLPVPSRRPVGRERRPE